MSSLGSSRSGERGRGPGRTAAYYSIARAMTRLACDGPTLIRAVAAAVANLERHVAEVDALNVFPSPMATPARTCSPRCGRRSPRPRGSRPMSATSGSVADALSRGALRGARGNSGVILAQILRGMTDGVDGRRRATGADLAAGLRRGSVAATAPSSRPSRARSSRSSATPRPPPRPPRSSEPHVETVLDVAIEAADLVGRADAEAAADPRRDAVSSTRAARASPAARGHAPARWRTMPGGAAGGRRPTQPASDVGPPAGAGRSTGTDTRRCSWSSRPMRSSTSMRSDMSSGRSANRSSWRAIGAPRGSTSTAPSRTSPSRSACGRAA